MAPDPALLSLHLFFDDLFLVLELLLLDVLLDQLVHSLVLAPRTTLALGSQRCCESVRESFMLGNGLLGQVQS